MMGFFEELKHLFANALGGVKLTYVWKVMLVKFPEFLLEIIPSVISLIYFGEAFSEFFDFLLNTPEKEAFKSFFGWFLSFYSEMLLVMLVSLGACVLRFLYSIYANIAVSSIFLKPAISFIELIKLFFDVRKFGRMLLISLVLSLFSLIFPPLFIVTAPTISIFAIYVASGGMLKSIDSFVNKLVKERHILPLIVYYLIIWLVVVGGMHVISFIITFLLGIGYSQEFGSLVSLFVSAKDKEDLIEFVTGLKGVTTSLLPWICMRFFFIFIEGVLVEILFYYPAVKFLKKRKILGAKK